MRIAILSLSMEEFHSNQFYNSQAEGLGKALADYNHDVTVYHWVTNISEKCITKYEHNVWIEYVKCRHIGKHALVPLRKLKDDLEFAIVFTDNNIDFPRVYKWFQEKKIVVAPYIGVLKSNNSNSLKKIIVDRICNNLDLYSRIPTVVKTPAIRDTLLQNGAKDVSVIPVGLDKTLLKQDYLEYPTERLRNNWGFSSEDIILLYIGRMTEEKKPVEMLEILENISKKDATIRLIMVGKGELESKIEQEIEKRHLKDYIIWLRQIENNKIWELYCISDWFVNLNEHEIFGMSILEAMYYGCPVVAKHSPGPDFILSNTVNGYLCQEKKEMESCIRETDYKTIKIIKKNAKQTVQEYFMWQSTAPRFLKWKEEHYDRKM